MLSWIARQAGRFTKYPGLKYQAPKLMYSPEDQANKPVVLLFGWLGASEKHVHKYTKLYQSKGSYPITAVHLTHSNCAKFVKNRTMSPAKTELAPSLTLPLKGYETIHYIPPMSLILAPKKIVEMNQLIQQDMIRILKANNLLRRPFLLHLFSNSGYLNWCFYQRYLRKQVPNTAYNILYKIQGTIIDSAPCTLTPPVLARGFLGALFPSIKNHRHWLLTPLFEWFWAQYHAKPEMTAEFAKTNRLMRRTVLPFPQWYMFSSNDAMIFASSIRRHIGRVEQRTGLRVNWIDFGDSDHVGHLRKHPTAYSRRIDAVLTKVERHWIAQNEFLAKHTAKSTRIPIRKRRRIFTKHNTPQGL